jgi:hypothetical protein
MEIEEKEAAAAFRFVDANHGRSTNPEEEDSEDHSPLPTFSPTVEDNGGQSATFVVNAAPWGYGCITLGVRDMPEDDIANTQGIMVESSQTQAQSNEQGPHTDESRLED